MASRIELESDLPPPISRVGIDREAGRYSLVPGSGTRPRALTVLVVDDDRAVVASIAEVLAIAGHAVTSVRTLRDARLYLSFECPAVVVLDPALGEALIDDLRALTRPPALVLLSSRRDAVDIAVATGAPLVAKPPKAERLLEAIRSAVLPLDAPDALRRAARSPR